MLNLNEYLSVRRELDQLDEFSVDNKSENMKAVKQYVENFFLKYLERDQAHLGFIEQAQEAVQYRLELADYGEEVREWLVDIYLKYGLCVDRLVEHLLSQCELFLLSWKDEDFSWYVDRVCDVYGEEYPFLVEDRGMLLRLVKGYYWSLQDGGEFPEIDDGVDRWVVDTYERYGVDLWAFAYRYLLGFVDDNDWFHDGYQAEEDFFNLGLFYRGVEDRPFMRGRKAELEALLLYNWLMYFVEDMSLDRKSTRLNSSHVAISYAVFCLKKKIQQKR